MTIPRSSFPATKLCLSRGQLVTRCQIRPTGTGAPDPHLGHCTIPIPRRLTTCRFHPVPHLEEPGATAAKLPAGSYLPAAGQPARPALPPTAPGPAPRGTWSAPSSEAERSARGGGGWMRARVRHPEILRGGTGRGARTPTAPATTEPRQGSVFGQDQCSAPLRALPPISVPGGEQPQPPLAPRGTRTRARPRAGAGPAALGRPLPPTGGASRPAAPARRRAAPPAPQEGRQLAPFASRGTRPAPRPHLRRAPARRRPLPGTAPRCAERGRGRCAAPGCAAAVGLRLSGGSSQPCY